MVANKPYEVFEHTADIGLHAYGSTLSELFIHAAQGMESLMVPPEQVRIQVSCEIDVEGHEFNVLQGLRRPVPYLSFELNLPEFRNEGLRCLKLLKHLDPLGRFNYIVGSHTKLAGEDWVNVEEFQRILKDSDESSIEVFWQTV